LSIGDVAVIAVFNDAQAAMSVAFEDLHRKIGGPLSPLQLRELAATRASINLQVEPRTCFFSQIDALAENYNIQAERPDEVHISDWDHELYGRIMYALTEEMLKAMGNGEEILSFVKSGRCTFLTTSDGTFDANSMELAQDSGSDSEKR
jgi:hypothetical protein